MNKSQKGIIIVIIGGLLGATGILMGGGAKTPMVVTSGGSVCRADVQTCPDGLRVLRTGPNCEFSACSSPLTLGYWQFDDHVAGVSYYYPPKIAAQHISATDWPPKFHFVTDPFSCADAGAETDKTGRIERRTINGKLYCVSMKSKDGSGSKYTQFAYAFEKNGVVPILTFSLAFSKCSAYSPEKKKACEAEQSTFDLDQIVDNIAGSLTFFNTFNKGSGIQGRVILKTCQGGDPKKCSNSGLSQPFGIFTSALSLVKNFTSDPTGAFRVDLSPGEYVIRKSQTGKPYCSDALVGVVRNAYSEVSLNCSTGV